MSEIRTFIFETGNIIEHCDRFFRPGSICTKKSILGIDREIPGCRKEYENEYKECVNRIKLNNVNNYLKLNPNCHFIKTEPFREDDSINNPLIGKKVYFECKN